MAYNGNVTLIAGTWTQLTANDVTTMPRVQNLGAGDIVVQATIGAAPGSQDGGIYLRRYDLIDGISALSAWFGGVTSGVRIWAYSTTPGLASVSHV